MDMHIFTCPDCPIRDTPYCHRRNPNAPTGEPGPAEQTPQESPVVDESLGVLPSIPRGLIKNERECLEALAPMYPRKDITRFCM